MTAIRGVYGGLRPIKTRKVWVLEIEIPEEEIKHVTDIMGFPNQSESQWVGVALLNEPAAKEDLTVITNKIPTTSLPTEKSEGDKLRVRAVMLCKNDAVFQKYCWQKSNLLQLGGKFGDMEALSSHYICHQCNIESRSELTTNKKAQEKFKELVNKFSDWKFENNYSSNLEREYVSYDNENTDSNNYYRDNPTANY